MWLAAYTVLQDILVMIDAVDLGNLLKSRNVVEKLHDRFGDKVWSIIYQGDVRCRLEHMTRIRRRAQADHDEAVAAGKTTSFDPARPWNYVGSKAVDDDSFWREEVVDRSRQIHGRLPRYGSGCVCIWLRWAPTPTSEQQP